VPFQVSMAYFQESLISFQESFKQNFIDDNRWKYLVDGVQYTLTITVFALVIGLVLGFVIAIFRVTHDTMGKMETPSILLKTANILMMFMNWLAKLYVTVIRGTPVVIQLMIIYYVIFSNINIDKIFTAVLAFGINSGAYVSEIFRAGIMSIDIGQREAGRSLGLNYGQTMLRIVMPQAIKNVLPAIGNECITLLKETSVAGYIAVIDLTRGADIIRSRTFQPFFPLLGAAAIYLLLVSLLQSGVNRIERRLAKSDRR